MSEHTPGPWAWGCDDRAEEHGPSQLVSEETGRPVLVADTYRSTPYIDIFDADARLIAAAPELLAACEAMIKWFDAENGPNFNGTEFYERMQMCRDAEDLSRAALKKAKGETP